MNTKLHRLGYLVSSTNLSIIFKTDVFTSPQWDFYQNRYAQVECYDIFSCTVDGSFCDPDSWIILLAISKSSKKPHTLTTLLYIETK